MININRRQPAFTLIEVITTIVVLAIAATAIMGVFTGTVRTSADPMIQQQAVSIAEAYMEEILSKPFSDPNIDGDETRSTFDDVDDYDGLVNNGAEDLNGAAISGLNDYAISVSVSNNNLNGADALLVTVNVAHALLAPIVLHGYRVNY